MLVESPIYIEAPVTFICSMVKCLGMHQGGAPLKICIPLNITFFKSIRMFCGTDHIPRIQSECEEYYVE